MIGVRVRQALVMVAIGVSAACSGATTTTAVHVGQGQQLAERQAALSAGPLRVLVRFDAGQERWADYVAGHAAAYVAAAERYLGVPHERARTRFYREPPRTRPDQFLIAGQASVYHDGQWFGGYHEHERGEHGVFIEYRLSAIGRPALLDHEIGHFWIDGLTWLSEGFVSFLPVAMANAGVLTLTDGEGRAVWKSWGAEDLRAPQDLPIQTDFRKLGKEQLLYYYRKAFKVQCLVYRELGPEGYQRFSRELATTAGRLRDDDAAIAVLRSIKPTTDFRALLSGWVLAGPYTSGDRNVCAGLGPRPGTQPATKGDPGAPASK